MAEESHPKKTGAERQTEILVAALERASQNGGVLINGSQKAAPRFYDKPLRITPVNALIMAMHADQNGFKTNSYIMFNDTHNRSEAVKRGQKGVPFIWTNLNQYVGKNNAEDKISRAEYNGLSDSEKGKYKVNPREDVYTVFNIDQTTMPNVHKEDYEKQVNLYGASEKKTENVTDDKALRNAVNQYIQSMKANLVAVRRDSTGIAHYDDKKDILYIPTQKNFASYPDYVQEVSRQVAHATGVPRRLGRDGVVLDGAKTPSQESQQREVLVEELVSAHKMLELGMPAKVRPVTLAMLPQIISQLKENPSLGNTISHDVNRTIGMIKKAENGEKIQFIEKPSEKRQQAWASQFPIDKVPVSFSQITMLKDDEGKWTLAAKPENDRIFAVHPSKEDVSMYFDMLKNDHEEGKIQDFRTQFAQKYYSVVANNPEKEVNLFRSDAPQEALDLINKVNAFKTKDNKILLVATIGDEKQKAVEISQSQWQRMWLADDKQDYKTHLAAILYPDVLTTKLQEMKHSTSPDVDGTKLHEERERQEQQKAKERQQQSPEQKEKEKKEEKAKEETTKQETKAVASIVFPPILNQFNDLKKKHPDAMLLFRCGDFYETYKDDAVNAAKILGIVLTKNTKQVDDEGKPLQMVGFPYHALDMYLPKLVRAGQRVAICDQLESPRQAVKHEEEPKLEAKEGVKEVVSQQQSTRQGVHR